MKANWPTKKLEEVCDFKVVRNTKDLPYVGMEDVESGSGKFLGANKVSRKVKSATNYFNNSCILYGKLRPYLNKVMLPDFEGHCSTEFVPLRPDSNAISREWLWFWLRSQPVVSLMSRNTSGSRMPRANLKKLKETEIPLPPLAEQKKIVAKLEKLLVKVNEAKKLRAEAQEAANQLLPAELHKIFEEGRKKYELEGLGNVSDLVRGPFGGSLRKDMFVDEGYAVYEQGNVIKDNTASFRYFISDEKFEEMKRFEVSSGDILMSCSGTIGKFTIIPQKFTRGIINQALLKITPHKDTDVDYLRYALDDYLKQSTTHIKGGAIKNITSVKELKKFEIPFPSIAEQKKIVARLDAISEKARQLQDLQKSTERDLLALEQSILHKAFSGGLVN